MVHTEVDCYDCGGYGCIMDPAVFVQNLSKRHYSLIHTPTLEALREQPLRAHRMERYEAALRAALVALEPIADLHIPSVDRAKWVIASALRKDETT